jgi:hypothetical protein
VSASNIRPHDASRMSWVRFMPVVTLRVAWIALLLGLLICAPGHAAPRLRVASPAGEPPLSDDGRWGVIPTTGGMIVLDGRVGPVDRRTVALAAPCGSQFGTPRGLGDHFVLVECSSRANEVRPRALVYDLAARRFTDVPGTEILLKGADGSLLFDVGRSWISFGINEHHGGVIPGLLDWHTGQAAPEPALARNEVPDLDARSGVRRICRSIRPPASRRQLRAYSRPFAVVQRGDARARRLVLERCDGPAVTLTRGRAVPALSLGRRAVAWAEGTTIHARSLRSGREQRWPVPGGEEVVGLTQVGEELFVTIRGGPNGGRRGFGFTVYRSRLP